MCTVFMETLQLYSITQWGYRAWYVFLEVIANGRVLLVGA